jgi:hypothetical protein
VTTLSDFLKVDGVDYPLAEYFNFLYATALRAEMTNTETITATKELTDNDVQFQVITASGADRTVELAPEAASNHVTIIENGGSSNHVVVKDDSGTVTLATLAPGDWILCFPVFGKTWRFIKNRTEDWIEVRETWAYASATTITVPTDATTRYQKGDRIRLKQGGSYKYFYGTGIAATVLTVNGGSDFTVANSAITDIAYSRVPAPLGFPVSFNWNANLSGVTLGSGVLTAKFQMIGALVSFHWEFVLGAGSAVSASVSFALPVTAGTYGQAAVPCGVARFKDAGASVAEQGLCQLSSTTTGVVAALDASVTYLRAAVLGASIPFVWATTDDMTAQGSYFA